MTQDKLAEAYRSRMNTWQELVSTQGDDAGALASLNLTDDARDRDSQNRLPHEEGFSP